MTGLYSAHVDLYDRAFGWDVSDEVDWLVSRLGPQCRSVLEPGCGTGRFFEAFERRGIDAFGFDRQAEMVEAASQRGTAVVADMAMFDLGRRFDGAICPIGTLALLTPEDAATHLVCMERHLVDGGRYLVQVAIRDSENPKAAIRASSWERAGVRVTWTTESVDLDHAVEHQRSTVEVVDGARAGETIEETHVVTAWTAATWARLVDRSPFEHTAVYDGELDERPRVELGSTGRLLWHELTRS